MSLQRLRRVRDDARLFYLIGNGIGTVRLVVSSHQFQKFVQKVFHVFDLGTELVRHDLHEQSRAAFLIGRSVHQAQLSVSFETVVSRFSHHFSCTFLCEHREEVQQCCRLLFVWWSRQHHCWWLSHCLQQGRIGRIECTRVSVECEIPVVKVFAWCIRLWLSDSHVLWARFRHRLSHCSHGFRESRHCCVHRSAWWLLTHFNHLCRENIKLTSQYLNFLSWCHRHYNTRNKSISQFQEYLLRYHARVGNDAKRVQRALCTRMRIVFSLIRLGPKTSVWRELCHCHVYSTRLWCDHCATTLHGINKQILYCVLERWTRTLDETKRGKKDWRGSNVHRNTELG